MATFKEFKNLDLIIAEIKEVKDHPNADKLFILKVDTGDEEKQLVAGIKGFYEKESLVGRQIVVVDNLDPVVIRGEESRGMLLAVQDAKGITLLCASGAVRRGTSHPLSRHRVSALSCRRQYRRLWAASSLEAEAICRVGGHSGEAGSSCGCTSILAATRMARPHRRRRGHHASKAWRATLGHLSKYPATQSQYRASLGEYDGQRHGRPGEW